MKKNTLLVLLLASVIVALTPFMVWGASYHVDQGIQGNRYIIQGDPRETGRLQPTAGTFSLQGSNVQLQGQ